MEVPFPTDPCYRLTHKTLGSIKQGTTETAILITRYHWPHVTTMPALNSEKEERQRQADMVVGIHDNFRQVKISDGVWPPDLLDRVIERMKRYPPEGPSCDAIEEAIGWLESLADAATSKVAPSNLKTTHTEGMMDRHEAASKVHDHKAFFCEQWDEFCRWVEACAAQLAHWQQNQTERPKEGGYVKWAVYDLETPAYYATHLRLEPWSVFYAPSDLVNPVNWLLGRNNPRPASSSQEERLRIGCARLVMAHDSTVADENCIYTFDGYKGDYGGEYFDCDAFCRDIRDRLATMEKNTDLAKAWDDVRPFLDGSGKQKIRIESSQRHTGEEEKSAYIFKNEGATWRIIYGEHEATVKNTKGMNCIRLLLDQPGKEVESLDLEFDLSQQERDPKTLGESIDGDNVHEGELDLNCNPEDKKDIEENVRVVKGVLKQRKRELDKAEDPAIRADLQDKIEKCNKYIAHHINRFGEVRPSGPAEEARKRVSAAINTAKKKIGESNATIGKHFRASVAARGTAFIYQPDRKITWISS